MEKFAFIILSILILLLMVLIHEAGHYTTAKILGFTVDEFAVGFGPKIFSRRRKNGELFSLRVLPLGGFCAFYGETDDEDDKKDKEKDKQEKVSEDKISDNNQNKQSVDCAETGENNAEESGEDLLSFVMRQKEAEDEEAAEKARAKAAPVGAAETVKEPRLGKDGKPALTFNAQKPWKRIIVLFGGVLFNFLSAIVFSLIYIWVVGFPVPEIGEVYTYVDPETQIVTSYNDFQAGDKIVAVDGQEISVMNTYSDIMEDVGKKTTVKFGVLRGGKNVTVVGERKQIVSPAYNGFEVGDKILSIDGKEVSKQRPYDDILSEILKDTKSKEKVVFEVLRGGETVKLNVERKDITPPNEVAKPYLGFGYVQRSSFIGNNAGNAFTYCVPYTFKLSWSILGSFGNILTGKESITNMTGPVGSINLMAEVTIADWRNILILLPLLASNLAIFNLLPIPALDGAHVVFTVIEWIRKKPINRKVEAMIHFVGMVVLLLFVFVVDILSFVL